MSVKTKSEFHSIEPRMRDFLMELSLLCSKHKVTIDGCGCCGSPYVKMDYLEKNEVRVSDTALSVKGVDLITFSEENKNDT